MLPVRNHTQPPSWEDYRKKLINVRHRLQNTVRNAFYENYQKSDVDTNKKGQAFDDIISEVNKFAPFNDDVRTKRTSLDDVNKYYGFLASYLSFLKKIAEILKIELDGDDDFDSAPGFVALNSDMPLGILSEQKLRIIYKYLRLNYFLEQQFCLLSLLRQFSYQDIKNFISENENQLRSISQLLNSLDSLPLDDNSESSQNILKQDIPERKRQKHFNEKKFNEQKLNENLSYLNEIKKLLENQLIESGFLSGTQTTTSFKDSDVNWKFITSAGFYPGFNGYLRGLSGADKSDAADTLRDFRIVAARAMLPFIQRLDKLKNAIVKRSDDLPVIARRRQILSAYFSYFDKLNELFNFLVVDGLTSELVSAQTFIQDVEEMVSLFQDVSPAEKAGEILNFIHSILYSNESRVLNNGWRQGADEINRTLKSVDDKDLGSGLLVYYQQIFNSFKNLFVRAKKLDLVFKGAEKLSDKYNKYISNIDKGIRSAREFYDDTLAKIVYYKEQNLLKNDKPKQGWFAMHWWKMLLAGAIISATVTLTLFILTGGLSIPVLIGLGVAAFIGGCAIGLGVGLATESCTILPGSTITPPSLEEAAKNHTGEEALSKLFVESSISDEGEPVSETQETSTFDDAISAPAASGETAALDDETERVEERDDSTSSSAFSRLFFWNAADKNTKENADEKFKLEHS